jgi:hypothetical protein
MPEQAAEQPHRKFAWLSLLAVPFPLLTIWQGFMLYLQPQLLAQQGFEVWAARPWLIEPVGIAVALLGLLGLLLFPWTRPAWRRWGILPTALLLLVANAGAYGGGYLSFGGPVDEMIYWNNEVITINGRAAVIGQIFNDEVRDCKIDYFTENRHKDLYYHNAENYQKYVSENCSCSTVLLRSDDYFLLTYGQKMRYEDYIKLNLHFGWQALDCRRMLLSINFSNPAICGYLLFDMPMMLVSAIERGPMRITETGNNRLLREICYRNDLPKRLLISFELPELS